MRKTILPGSPKDPAEMGNQTLLSEWATWGMDCLISSGSYLGSRPGEHGCLECSSAGDQQDRLGRCKRGWLCRPACRGQAVKVGCERGLPVGERSWGTVRAGGGNTVQAFVFPFASLLRDNYPTDSFPLPANAWLKPAKHPLALKFQNLQGCRAGNREPAKKEKKKLSATEQSELPMNTEGFFMAWVLSLSKCLLTGVKLWGIKSPPETYLLPPCPKWICSPVCVWQQNRELHWW